MRWKYVLFDLDGTLTDSRVGVANGVAHALNTLGLEPPQGDDILQWLGPPLSTSFREYVGLDESRALEAIRLYREYYNHTGAFENQVFAGIPELIAQLKESGNTLAVATSKVDYAAVAILEHFGLSQFFDTIVGADEYGVERGTKSLVIKQALQDVSYSVGESAVMIGDRWHDIHGAHEHGLDSIGVLWGYGEREEIENAGAGLIATHVPELHHILAYT